MFNLIVTNIFSYKQSVEAMQVCHGPYNNNSQNKNQQVQQPSTSNLFQQAQQVIKYFIWIRVAKKPGILEILPLNNMKKPGV